MSKPRSRKHVEEYDADDGFVEDAPKSKKHKVEAKPRNGDMQKDDEGNEYWELSGKRRVQVSQFKGNTMIGIREFYEQNGKALPGKKGISMTVDQYTAFLALVPDIEHVLKQKGIIVPRPQYDKSTEEDEEDGEEVKDGKGGEDEEDGPGTKDGEAEEGSASRFKGKLDRFKRKNHEATSDEDEG